LSGFRKGAIFIAGLLLLTLFLPPVLQAETAEELLAFADYLAAKGEFYRAITEYERLRFLYPGHGQRELALSQIVTCYLEAEQYEKAALSAEMFLDEYPASEQRFEVMMSLVASYKAQNKFSEAAGELEYFLQKNPEDSYQERILEQVAFCYLKEKKWDMARQAFEKLALLKDGHRQKPASRAVQELSEPKQLARRSPAAAGWFSAIIPGSGQLYCSRAGDAFAAFTVNGLFGYLTVDAFRKKEYVLGSLLGMLELGWYTGNIYTAVNAAHKFNKEKESRLIERVNNVFYLPALSWERKSYGVTLAFSF